VSVPTVSVLMPVYNCERYLDEAIRSIREQTFTDFEFVIVNDGSTDGSLDIIRRHAAEDARIIILDRPNGGIVAALNAGLEVCRGEFIARMDGDDISERRRLAFQHRYLAKNHEMGAVGSSSRRIDSIGSITGKSVTDPESSLVEWGLLFGGGAILHATTLMRRSDIEAVGGYDPSPNVRHAEDHDLWTRMVMSGVRLANLSQPLYRVRASSAQVSHRYHDEQWRASVSVVERYSEWFAKGKVCPADVEATWTLLYKRVERSSEQLTAMESFLVQLLHAAGDRYGEDVKRKLCERVCLMLRHHVAHNLADGREKLAEGFDRLAERLSSGRAIPSWRSLRMAAVVARARYRHWSRPNTVSPSIAE